MSITVTTKMKIQKPVNQVFEALVDPDQMSHYWFSSGSARWEAGKTITLRYAEYGAQVDIYVAEVQPNRLILFRSGAAEDPHVVTMTLTAVDDASAIIEVTQTGWKEDDEALISHLLDNKEGWVYMLTCLKAYLEFGVSRLRAGLVK